MGIIQFFVQNPLAIPLFLVMFTLIIAVHEFGHYITARLLGMRVLEFAFGFPPRILAIRRGGIDYSVNAIPFGGFVRILGQDDFSIEQQGADARRVPQGEGQVITGWQNKLQAAIAHITPADRLAEIHTKKAKPGTAEAAE